MKALVSPKEITEEFERCCRKYDNLYMAVAWVGNPKFGIPFGSLSLLNKIQATIGIAFYQTHPDGIRHFLNLNANGCNSII